ncbi:unnamed protein product [Sphacelaria rigidula]
MHCGCPSFPWYTPPFEHLSPPKGIPVNNSWCYGDLANSNLNPNPNPKSAAPFRLFGLADWIMTSTLAPRRLSSKQNHSNEFCLRRALPTPHILPLSLLHERQEMPCKKISRRTQMAAGHTQVLSSQWG